MAELPEFLREGDLLVVNDTKVFPARLLGARVPSGGAVECLSAGEARRRRAVGCAGASGPEAAARRADGLSRAAGTCFTAKCSSAIFTAAARFASGRRTARPSTMPSTTIGHMPLPPYIKRDDDARAIASGIRRSTRASADRWRRRPPGCISRRKFWTRLTREAWSARRSRCTSATARSSRCASSRWRRTRSIRSAFRSARRRPTPSIRAKREERRVVAVGTTTTRALEAAGRAGRGDRHAAVGLDRSVHLSRVRVRHRRRADDELPPAAVVAADAGVRLRRPRARAGRLSRGGATRYRFYSYGDAMLIL